MPSNEYKGTRTVYTAKLIFARDYFRKRLPEATELVAREQLFKALTQRFRFNIHELSNEIDVFVAFETMNNRGQPLSRLELLKNRLILPFHAVEKLGIGAQSGPDEYQRCMDDDLRGVGKESESLA